MVPAADRQSVTQPTTGSPPTHTRSTRAAPISSRRLRTGRGRARTRSATAPGPIVPASSRWFTHAEPEVYAAKRGLEVERLLGEERLAARQARARRTPCGGPRRGCAASGSGVLTGQSLPATRRAPARWRSPKGYCRAAARRPRNGMVSSTIWSSWHGPQRLDVGRDAELGEPRRRRRGARAGGGRCGGGRSGVGALERVEGLAHAAVAETVDVHLEARRVEGADVPRSASGSTNEMPRLSVGVPAAVEVGLDERGRAVLDDTVLHDLHRGGGEPTRASAVAALATSSSICSSAPLAVPPQRPDHRAGEVAVAGGARRRSVRCPASRSTPRRWRPASR